MTQLSYEHYIPEVFLKDFKEELWVDEQLVREAWCIELDEAQPIINDLLEAFPDLTREYLCSMRSNMIGYATNYRPPYTNGCISWYTWDYPTEQDHLDYNIFLPDGCNLHRWFGKKYDMETKKTWLKYVFKSSTLRCPTLPACKAPPFYAMISDQEGNVFPQVDVYFNSTHEDMKQYCHVMGLTYPAPPELENYDTRRLWAIVYDYESLKITKAKAYDIFNFKKRSRV